MDSVGRVRIQREGLRRSITLPLCPSRSVSKQLTTIMTSRKRTSNINARRTEDGLHAAARADAATLTTDLSNVASLWLAFSKTSVLLPSQGDHPSSKFCSPRYRRPCDKEKRGGRKCPEKRGYWRYEWEKRQRQHILGTRRCSFQSFNYICFSTSFNSLNIVTQSTFWKDIQELRNTLKRIDFINTV